MAHRPVDRRLTAPNEAGVRPGLGSVMLSAGQAGVGADVRGAQQPRIIAEQAAALLGWDGLLLERCSLFGRQVTVVARFDQQVHAARVASGWGPVTDRMTVGLWEEWPEQCSYVPPSPVHLEGFLACGTRWQPALSIAGGFVGFGSTAILLEQVSPPTAYCLMKAQLHGVGVLYRDQHRGDLEIVQAGRRGAVPTARPSSISRWAEEVVYQSMVDSYQLADAASN